MSRIFGLCDVQLVVVHQFGLAPARNALLALALARDVVLAVPAIVAAGADFPQGERIDRHAVLRCEATRRKRRGSSAAASALLKPDGKTQARPHRPQRVAA